MLPLINNTAKVKQVNVELVKTALKSLQFGTKLTIANATGLSVATCGTILNDLLARGEVIEADLEQSGGGRPARRFMYNANYAYIACIYVSNEGGIHRIVQVIANLMGEIIEEKLSEVESINHAAIDKIIETLLCKFENIKAIGIGVPGVIHKGVIIACDIGELVGLSLAGWLKAKYSLPVTVENDMNLITYGFYKKQNYDEDKTVTVITFPRNVCSGAGIIIDGRIFRGNTNFAGEVSYLPFKCSRKEQVKLTNSSDLFFPLMIKTMVSIIAIINPETIVITGNLIRLDMADDIYNICEAMIPQGHMPRIIIQENMQADYIHGLISISLESLTCDFQLVEKNSKVSTSSM
ncbi:hypothetical protein P22_2903 [Propionispora sp. 2/2-37]|uniref:ROK family protein n=1 Tax=Propionispora sp. 2/2-37 TaxID=1677858 RepID=UPI0006BB96B6|nr:ROK family protein [Propionispora sp. 2/2-37]CUH96792.1 hypothetical protein P22_2903 [Propionispora sp. 2/2-37]